MACAQIASQVAAKLYDIVIPASALLMIERKPLSVSLTPELHAFVGDLVAGGGYGNASEVVRAGLRLLRHEEAARQRQGSKGAAGAMNVTGRDRRDARG